MIIQRLRYWQWIGMILVGCVLGFGGCSSVQVPTATLSQAKLAVEQANQSKTYEYASLELQTARDHLNEAKQAMQEENYKLARRQAEKALVNAQVALSSHQ